MGHLFRIASGLRVFATKPMLYSSKTALLIDVSADPFCCVERRLLLIFQVFYEIIAQFLRRNLCPPLRGVKFGVSVTPLVIFLFGDFSGIQFCGLFAPSGKHLEHFIIGSALRFIKPKADFSVHLSDLHTAQILQRKQCMHQSGIAVNVGNIQGIWRNLQDGSKGFCQSLIKK